MTQESIANAPRAIRAWPVVRLRDDAGRAYATQYLAHIDIGDVAMVWAPEGDEAQEKNARLLGAAPALASALRALLEACAESYATQKPISINCAEVRESWDALNLAGEGES